MGNGNTNSADALLVDQEGDVTKLVVNGKILKTLTGTRADKPGVGDGDPNSAGTGNVKISEANIIAGSDESKIVEILTGAGVGDVEEILIWALFCIIEDTDEVIAD